MPMDDHSLKYSAIPIWNIHMNSSFHKKETETHTRTGIAFQGHHTQNQCQLASIRSIKEEIERNKSTLTLHFHRTPSQRQSTKVCTTYGMNIPMLVSFIHGISYWHLCGFLFCSCGRRNSCGCSVLGLRNISRNERPLASSRIFL